MCGVCACVCVCVCVCACSSGQVFLRNFVMMERRRSFSQVFPWDFRRRQVRVREQAAPCERHIPNTTHSLTPPRPLSLPHVGSPDALERTHLGGQESRDQDGREQQGARNQNARPRVARREHMWRGGCALTRAECVRRGAPLCGSCTPRPGASIALCETFSAEKEAGWCPLLTPPRCKPPRPPSSTAPRC